ncbi:uncharacterized protein [Elaeis guineensis]|uniref:uncharacterized protein n=1 Tax=Elaeis guineensis var. tenera TaxID=51953 RepID=UPI003C6D7867
MWAIKKLNMDLDEVGQHRKLQIDELEKIKNEAYDNAKIYKEQTIVNTLSLRSLLNSDKLIGLNFDSWYRKLKIILEHERILYVLTDPASEEPATNALHAVKNTYLKWLSDRTTVHCIMRAAMNDKLSRKFEDVQPEDMIQVLNKSFGISQDAERHKTSCTVFNVCMREGTSVIDHVLYMIE